MLMLMTTMMTLTVMTVVSLPECLLLARGPQGQSEVLACKGFLVASPRRVERLLVASPRGVEGLPVVSVRRVEGILLGVVALLALVRIVAVKRPVGVVQSVLAAAGKPIMIWRM